MRRARNPRRAYLPEEAKRPGPGPGLVVKSYITPVLGRATGLMSLRLSFDDLAGLVRDAQ